MPDTEKIKKVIGRFGSLKKRREPFEPMWEESATYTSPYRSLYADSAKEGEKVGNKVFNGLPVVFVNTVADGFLGNMTSRSSRWLGLRMADRKLEVVAGVREWLQGCEEVLYSAFQRSNFYESMHEYFIDGVTIGTATMYIEEDIENNRINFMTCHPWEVYIDETAKGRVDTVFRQYDLTYRQVGKYFEKDGLEEQIKNRAEKTPDVKVKILHAVYPRDLWITENASSKNKKYASEYYLLDEQKLLRESGYDMLPYVVWRWRKNTNELYGRSPTSDAITEIKRANLVVETDLRAAQMAADPPWNVPDELKGKVRIRPRGMNYYEEAGRTVSPVYTGGGYQFGVEREERIEAILRKHYKVDFFQMMAEIDSQRTATEIMARQGENAIMLGANVGRLENECLDPAVDLVFAIKLRAGQLPEIPAELMRYGGQSIDVDYIGPLAQAQKRLFKTQGTQRFLEFATGIFQIRPETMDIVKWDEVVREGAEDMGASAKLINDDKEVEGMRAARAQQIEQQQKLEQLSMMADAAPKLGKKIEEGSPIDQMEKVAAGQA